MQDLINYFLKHTWVRFIIAGGTSAFVDLTLLFVLSEVFKVYYLLSAILAFIGAFGVSFTLHKYWTFKSHQEETHKQAFLYLFTQFFGLLLNTALMYIFVDLLKIYVMLAQFIAGILVAFCSYFIARNLVFKTGEVQVNIQR
jgi:putative flippase GtrA